MTITEELRMLEPITGENPAIVITPNILLNPTFVYKLYQFVQATNPKLANR